MQLWHYRLLVTARLLYMYRTLSASIIRSTKNCSSSHWCCILHSDTIWQIDVFLTACICEYTHNYLQCIINSLNFTAKLISASRCCSKRGLVTCPRRYEIICCDYCDLLWLPCCFWFLIMFVVFNFYLFIYLFPCQNLHWPVEPAGCCSRCCYPIITPHVTIKST